jgi:hypothetical protein
MSQISVTGTIELKPFTPENAEALKNQTKTSGCGFNVTDDCIYLGDIDNTHRFIENYCLYVASLLPEGHEPLTFKCKGETVDDVRDLIIEDKRVYIQYYVLEKHGEREEYKGE